MRPNQESQAEDEEERGLGSGRVHNDQKPTDRTPTGITDISEATRRGAGMLAAPIAHEVYHQFLPGGIDGD